MARGAYFSKSREIFTLFGSFLARFWALFGLQRGYVRGPFEGPSGPENCPKAPFLGFFGLFPQKSGFSGVRRVPGSPEGVPGPRGPQARSQGAVWLKFPPGRTPCGGAKSAPLVDILWVGGFRPLVPGDPPIFGVSPAVLPAALAKTIGRLAVRPEDSP